MLKDEIRSAFNNARKSGDHVTKDALEAVIAGILQKEKTEVGKVLTDGEVIECISKELKVQREVVSFSAEKMPEKAAESEAKINILTSFLPKQLTEEEVLKIIAEADVYSDASPKTKGMIIKAVMPQINGKFDKSKVNPLVETYLAEKYN